jgi:hypothetical protein
MYSSGRRAVSKLKSFKQSTTTPGIGLASNEAINAASFVES